MTIKEQLLQEIEKVPEPLLQEVRTNATGTIFFVGCVTLREVMNAI